MSLKCQNARNLKNRNIDNLIVDKLITREKPLSHVVPFSGRIEAKVKRAPTNATVNNGKYSGFATYY